MVHVVLRTDTETRLRVVVQVGDAATVLFAELYVLTFFVVAALLTPAGRFKEEWQAIDHDFIHQVQFQHVWLVYARGHFAGMRVADQTMDRQRPADARIP